MQTIRLTLPKRHVGQERIHNESKRFNVIACGRRFGKTTFGIDRLATDMTLRYPVAWLSPTYKMLVEVWREAARILKPIIVRQSAQERRLELLTGGVIEFWSLDNPDVARGRKYRRLIIDEAAMIKQLVDAWQMVLRPTLADYEGDAYFLSTPKGMNGFYRMFQWGIDPLMDEWACWQMPTRINPRIPPSEIEAMRKSMPERIYQQEVEAVFLEDAGGVFRRVMDAATASEMQQGMQGKSYVYGVDWGKHSDFTVLSVFDLETKRQVCLDRFNQIDYSVQMSRLEALCARFAPAAIVVERNSMGEPLVELLQRKGLPIVPFTTTNTSKMALIDGLAMAFERGAIEIINDPVQIAELQAYEMEKLPSGLLRYSAPEGIHDDTVMAMALAWLAVDYQAQPNVIYYDEAVSISPY